MAGQGVEKMPAHAAPAMGGVDPEALDPAAALLEPEFAAADVAEHEADDLAADLGHPRALGVAPQVIGDAVLPELRSIDAADLLVDAGDRLDVRVGQGADNQVRCLDGHGLAPRAGGGQGARPPKGGVSCPKLPQGAGPRINPLRPRPPASNVSLTEVVVSEAPPQAFASWARTPTGPGHPSILFPMNEPVAPVPAAAPTAPAAPPVLVSVHDGVASLSLN